MAVDRPGSLRLELAPGRDSRAFTGGYVRTDYAASDYHAAAVFEVEHRLRDVACVDLATGAQS